MICHPWGHGKLSSMGLNNLLCLGQDLFFPIPRIPSITLRNDWGNSLQVQTILLDQSVTFSLSIHYRAQNEVEVGGGQGRGSAHYARSGRRTNLAQTSLSYCWVWQALPSPPLPQSPGGLVPTWTAGPTPSFWFIRTVASPENLCIIKFPDAADAGPRCHIRRTTGLNNRSPRLGSWIPHLTSRDVRKLWYKESWFLICKLNDKLPVLPILWLVWKENNTLANYLKAYYYHY